MEKVAIVIPIYRTHLNPEEILSLTQCLKVLSKYPIRFMGPQSLNTEFLKPWIEEVEMIRFEDNYFKSPKTYNKLLTSPFFYEAFSNFEYILIHQLDAYVFEDQLLEWCAKGFDYIGAPKLRKHHLSNSLSCQPVLLNGGLSLRKVKPILRYIKIYHIFFENGLPMKMRCFRSPKDEFILFDFFSNFLPGKKHCPLPLNKILKQVCVCWVNYLLAVMHGNATIPNSGRNISQTKSINRF